MASPGIDAPAAPQPRPKPAVPVKSAAVLAAASARAALPVTAKPSKAMTATAAVAAPTPTPTPARPTPAPTADEPNASPPAAALRATTTALGQPRAVALWTSLSPTHDQELCFHEGDELTILDSSDSDWWKAKLADQVGWVPATYVRMMEEETSVDVHAGAATPAITLVQTAALTTSNPPTATTTTTTTIAAVEAPSAVADTKRLMRAQFSSIAEHAAELSFNQGDLLEIVDDSNLEWWQAHLNGAVGWVPSSFLVPADDEMAAQDEPRKLSTQELRERVINEIITTERDYIRNLSLVIEGYKRRMEVLESVNKSDVETLFSNIEDIHTFQCQFEKKMAQAIAFNPPLLGRAFIEAKDNFKIYAVYCVNHPKAISYLAELQKSDPKLKAFFLGCRLLIEQDIALEGFLLTPIQRLCKYPLLLRELQKYTDASHPDNKNIEDALAQMKEVASFVNEMQRQKDNKNLIADLQTRIEGWEGPDLVENNTELLMEATMIKVSHGKAQGRHIFLFDKTLVYAKENPLKKKMYSFKGSIPLSKCNVSICSPSEDTKGYANAWQVTRYDLTAPKTYIVSAKTTEERAKWVHAIESAQSKLDFVIMPEKKPQVTPPGQPTLPTNGASAAVPIKPRSGIPAGAVALPMLGSSLPPPSIHHQPQPHQHHPSSDRDPPPVVEKASKPFGSIAFRERSGSRGDIKVAIGGATSSPVLSPQLFSEATSSGSSDDFGKDRPGLLVSAIRAGSSVLLRTKRTSSDVSSPSEVSSAVPLPPPYSGRRTSSGGITPDMFNKALPALPVQAQGSSASMDNILKEMQRKRDAAAAASTSNNAGNNNRAAA